MTTGYEDEWSKVYGHDRDPVRNHLVYPLIDAWLDRWAPQTWIDAGCGNGGLIAHAQDRAFVKAYGLDLSDEFLDQARAHVRDSRVEFRKADLREDWPVPAGEADAVVSVFVLNEIDDLTSVACAMAASLRPGGRGLLVMTHPFQILHERIAAPKVPKISGNLDYFGNDELVYHFSLSDATASYFHHNLDDSTGAFAAAGLTLHRIHELTPNEALLAAEPAYADRVGHPLYIAFEVVRDD